MLWFNVVCEQRRTGGLFLGVMVFYMIVLLCVMGKVEMENRAIVVGSICVVIGSFMYSAPMTVIVSDSLHLRKPPHCSLSSCLAC